MGMPAVAINFTAVIVATVISYIIGALWYSPVLFGKQWMKYMKFTQKDMEKAKKQGMTKNYVVMFVAIFVMAYVLAHIIKIFTVGTASGGMQTAFWIWLGFFATTQIGTVLWEGKPFNFYLINTGHYLVVLLVMGAILAVW